MGYLDTVTDADLAALMEQAFSAVDEVCSQLSDDDWDLPTDLDGWSVKDNVSHLAHFESVLAGRPEPDHDFDASMFPHVRNEFQAVNERGIDARRRFSGEEILAEFRDATSQRIKTLTGYTEADWSGEVPSPFGMMPARRFLPIRILDVFCHEQDIRRAVGIPGHLNGDVARFTFERFATISLPRVIGKEAGAPEGSAVVLDVAPPGRRIGYVVRNGVCVIDDIAEPSVTFTMNMETFIALLAGRRPAPRFEREGGLRVKGDRALADAVLAKIGVTP